MTRKRHNGALWDRSGLACPESIAHLWVKGRPATRELFAAIADEAVACLARSDWESRVRRMENILSVIKWRIRQHWESQQESDLDRLVGRAKEGDAT